MDRDMTKVALDSTVSFIEQKRELERKKTERDLVKQVSKKTMDFIERIRKLEEGSSPTLRETVEKGKSSTLIVAAKCKNGVVMVADRRTMRGTEYKEEKKIYEFYKVIIAFAGLTGLKDKFLEIVEGVLSATRVVNLGEAIVGVEDTMALISDRYEKRLGGEARIVALLAGLEHLTSGEAKLYHVFGNGYAEEVDFLCIGHGAPYATSLAQGLYRSDLSMERMAEIGIFLSCWVEKVDSSVGGIPDVVFVENNKGIKDMEEVKVKQIYENAEEVAKILHELLPKAIQDPKILLPKKEK
jgi:20S proteasome alpha/beta subunit